MANMLPGIIGDAAKKLKEKEYNTKKAIEEGFSTGSKPAPKADSGSRPTPVDAKKAFMQEQLRKAKESQKKSKEASSDSDFSDAVSMVRSKKTAKRTSY